MEAIFNTWTWTCFFIYTVPDLSTFQHVLLFHPKKSADCPDVLFSELTKSSLAREYDKHYNDWKTKPASVSRTNDSHSILINILAAVLERRQ